MRLQVPTAKLLIGAVSPNAEISDGSDIKASAVLLKLPSEKNLIGGPTRSVYELDCIPLWGSVIYIRSEMEDAVAAVPRFAKVPIKMLIGDRVVDGISESLTHLTSHFMVFMMAMGAPRLLIIAVTEIHLALAEEFGNIKNNSNDGIIWGDQQLQWEKAFSSCFHKVDDEIGGKSIRGLIEGDGNASISTPETVWIYSCSCLGLLIPHHSCKLWRFKGSTLSWKRTMALSVDHKPNREDEYARIEASGGKVIQWNGHRVFGVLAMSRSIGDRYLKPCIIPDPEVMFLPRAKDDECLILASDGLWDVITNEEACEVARRRILLWHKKNGVATLLERGKAIDPAAQAAADYLSMLALQKGSKIISL
ncbi:LOW QUALITY PROTEIN: hypothetical protein NC652_008224 [Populus alba x Populus x berolinensis]|nr:LOW QUALITY PROTEIN: hypothetical protein NC652_008224 [Populus alba x Populus x berolinensis]